MLTVRVDGLPVVLFDLSIASHQRGDMDVRAIDIPRALLYLPLFIGFALMTSEFVRFLLGRDSLYRRTNDTSKGM